MFETKEVEVNGEIYNVHELSVRQRRDLFAAHKEMKDATLLSVNLILCGVVELADKDEDTVLDLPGTVFDALSNAVADASGMGDPEKEKEGDKGNVQKPPAKE